MPTVFAGLSLAVLLLAQVPGYRDIRAGSGIDFQLVSGSPKKPFILESMGGGVAIFDYNNDGLPDIYLTNGSTIELERNGANLAEDRLFKNLGGGKFADVTKEAGLGDTRWTMGVAVADVNNDGFDDLLITNYGGNRLYLNQGNGTFRDFSRESGLESAGWSSGAAFADFDGDGDLDVYISAYLRFDLAELPRDGLFCRYREIPVQCGPRGLTALHGKLFENLGAGRFRDVTEPSGIAAAPNAYGLGAVWGDYDNDGKPDLFVANDSLPNFLFHNSGNSTFTEVALASGVALREDGREQAGMGVDFGDYDNDGHLDLIVTTFSDDYKTLFRNNGDGTFTDRSGFAGLVKPTWSLLSWGVQFADMDNDGYLDFVMANGHVYPEVDSRDLGTTYRQAPSLFLNARNGTFRSKGAEAGPAFQARQSSRGLAVGDLNNDGALDVVISNLDAQPYIIMSPGPSGNWLEIRLRGTESNRDGVGARVTVQAGGMQQIREVKSGGSYLSHSDFRLHFGLGKLEEAARIQVVWPGGKTQTLSRIQANGLIEIEEPRSAKKR